MDGGDERRLTEDEIEDSIAFADGASALAGAVPSPNARADAEQALRGEITMDEAVARAARRARQEDD